MQFLLKMEIMYIEELAIPTWQCCSYFVDSDSHSDSDDFFEDDDMYSRLEETRAKLETELGCDTFLKAYKTVQVLV